jgi:hypothetical protein
MTKKEQAAETEAPKQQYWYYKCRGFYDGEKFSGCQKYFTFDSLVGITGTCPFCGTTLHAVALDTPLQAMVHRIALPKCRKCAHTHICPDCVGAKNTQLVQCYTCSCQTCCAETHRIFREIKIKAQPLRGIV